MIASLFLLFVFSFFHHCFPFPSILDPLHSSPFGPQLPQTINTPHSSSVHSMKVATFMIPLQCFHLSSLFVFRSFWLSPYYRACCFFAILFSVLCSLCKVHFWVSEMFHFSAPIYITLLLLLIFLCLILLI